MIMEEFESNKITPDVISVAPKIVINVVYEKSHKEVKLGNEITPKDVKDQPKVQYEASNDEFYPLIMVDPDAPSRKNPTQREWQHWLVVNIPGGNIENGQVLTEYAGATPPKNTGLHRYVFLLYKQPGKLKFKEPQKAKGDSNRGKFSTENFANKYKLGPPVAGNFFQAQSS